MLYVKGSEMITNDEEVIDSRDIKQRIEYLQRDLECFLEDNGFEEDFNYFEVIGHENWDDVATITQENVDDVLDLLQSWEYSDEYISLMKLQEECEHYCEWDDGAFFIRDDYFEEYAEQLCEDIGDLPKEVPSYIVIDWEATALNIQEDYMSAEFDGVKYWVR